ncbi:MAG: hypothetical protein J6W62_07345 [Spirochaetia bacterium]|nr:hypothetical protein [Spirochaetia bacterium]
MKKEILSDEPINKPEEDILGRESFAKNLADSLISWKEEKSLIIGLLGKWGSGKTSVINLTEYFLKDILRSQTKEKNKPIVIKFNPWGYSQTEDLLISFINQLYSSIKDNKKIRKLTKVIKKYINFFKEIKPQKTINTVLTITALVFTILGISLSHIFQQSPEMVNSLTKRTIISLAIYAVVYFSWRCLACILTRQDKLPISEIKEEISNIIIKNKIRMIIIIDDIDRLTSVEIKQLFRIIRINADFPNTIYLLSFDRNIAEKSLTVQDTISGHDYLEKIINIEYDLPGISQFKLEKYFKNNLEKLISALPDNTANIFETDNKKWSQIHSIIISELSSIRNIKRYFNSISFKINQFIKENVLEINLVDFLGIELIRLKYPDCYSFIRDNKQWFISDKMLKDEPGAKEKGTYAKWYKDNVQKFGSTTNEKNNINIIITEIFPITFFGSKNIQINSLFNKSEIDATNSIASERFFDIYFDHISSISDEECSNYDAQRIKAVSNDYDALKTLLREYINNNKIHSLLDLLEKHSIEGDLIPKDNYLSYFAALFDIINEIPDGHERLQFGNDTIIHRIVYFLIRFNDKYENADLFEKLIENTEDPFMCCDFIENEINNYKEQKEELVARNRIPYLQQKMVKKIYEYRDKLLDSKYFIRMLYFWRKNDFASYQRYIYDLASDINKLLRAIERTFYLSYSKSNDGTEKAKKEIRYDDVKLLGDLENIRNRLHLIRFGNGELYRTNKEIINLFLDNYEKDGVAKKILIKK